MGVHNTSKTLFFQGSNNNGDFMVITSVNTVIGDYRGDPISWLSSYFLQNYALDGTVKIFQKHKQRWDIKLVDCWSCTLGDQMAKNNFLPQGSIKCAENLWKYLHYMIQLGTV